LLPVGHMARYAGVMALLVEPSACPDKPEPHAWSAPPPAEDQRVILNGMTWKDYEILLAVRGDEKR